MDRYLQQINKIIRKWYPAPTENLTFIQLGLPVLVILLYIDFQFTNIGFLPLHSIDDYAFHGSLLHMYTGLTDGSVKALFGYGFYQYGFLFFFINLIATIPAFITNHTVLSIAIPRIITSLFALGSLVTIFKFSRLYLEKLPSILFAAFFVTMPAFWFNATWFHPDWAMTFFLLLFLYFLARDNWAYNRNFKLAVLFYALAIACKYQAVTFMPILGLYIFYDTVRTLKFSGFLPKLSLFIKSIVAIVVIFIFSNPYILHPVGWRAFVGSFVANMQSNATNNGNAAAVTLADKINFAIGDYYLNIIFLFILICASLWLVFKYIKLEKRSIFSVISITFLVNLLYLLFFVNKAWQMYYLPVFSTGLLSLLYFGQKLSIKKQVLGLSSVIVIQVIIFSPSYYSLLAQSQNREAPDFNTYSKTENIQMNEFIIASLRGHIKPTDNVLITPYTPFEYDRLYLPFDNVRVIFGSIAPSQIDEQAYITAQKNFWGDTKTAAEIASSFKPIQFIILRKDIPFIDTKKIAGTGNKALYTEGNKLMSELYAGNLGYDVLAENKNAVIFEYHNEQKS